jgi:hypothetical protein
MSTPPRVPKLGRRPTDPHRLARTIRLPLTGAVPAHPLVTDHLSLVPAWNGTTNFSYGTCGPVFVANSVIVSRKYLLGETVTVTDDDIFDLYRRSGNPDFDPATGAGDRGVDMTVMLAELVRGGLWITRTGGARELVKPLCFAMHDTGIETVHAVTSIFGFDGFGLDLDVAQQAQTDTGVWDYIPGSGSWGGHAVMAGAYTSDPAAHHVDESLISWLERIGTTDAFLGHQLAEAYVVVWPELWSHPAFQAGVDQAALAKAFTDCTRRPFPIPVPPAPPPPPPPPPPPAPVADAIDRAFWTPQVDAWAHGRRTGLNKIAATGALRWAHEKRLTG